MAEGHAPHEAPLTCLKHLPEGGLQEWLVLRSWVMLMRPVITIGSEDTMADASRRGCRDLEEQQEMANSDTSKLRQLLTADMCVQ